MINGHEHGNGTAIVTRGGDAACNFDPHVKIGPAGANIISVSVAHYSFGGCKRSLFGDHHLRGIEGVRPTRLGAAAQVR